MENKIIRAIDKNKSVRIFVADTTNMVQKIRDIHESSATASAAMGRLATITSIMGIALLDDKDKLTIIFDGKGPGGKLTSVTNSKGEVKVTVQNPLFDPPSRYPGKLNVGAFVGTEGNLSVIRDLGLKEPYVGISKIITGEIAEDMANYYFYSEQTPTIISLGVLVDTDLSIKAAGGIFVQVLPGITENELKELEKVAANLKPVSELIKEGKTPEDILDEYFYKLEPEILETHEVDLKCDCDGERIRAGIESLGKKEIQDIIDEDGEAEVICEFCKTRYHFDKNELEKMIKNAR